MTKTEFLSKLEIELKKNRIADTSDIVGEYEEHFAFKLADGYSEEEISAKLGSPAELATQFEKDSRAERSTGRKITAVIGLCFVDLMASLMFITLWMWEFVMGAAAISFTALASCLVLKLNVYSLIPPMPYWCSIIFGLSFIALAVLAAVGCVWFAAYLRQLMRAFLRFHHNTMASASGRPVLPALPVNPKLEPKTKRIERRLALASLTAFAAFFVLGAVVAMLSAGSLQFWHAWGWFGFAG